MEIEMAVEKERKVTEKERKEKELAIKQMEDKKIEIVTNLLNLKSFSEKQIAEIAKVTVEFVQQIKKKMKTKTHEINNMKIAEISSEQNIINNVEDGVDLLGNIYYQGFDKIIIYQKNITPDFFELKNRMAGEILQKFSTYGIQLAIVGDFSIYNSKNLKDFIFESNKGNQINFVSSRTEALKNKK